MAGAMGVQAKLGFGSTSTVDKPLDFQTESIRLTNEIVDCNGIKGTRSRYAARAPEGRQFVGGQITCQPTPVELAALLPWMLGAAESSGTFALAETLPVNYIAVDRVMKVPVYSGCAVDSWTIRSGPGQPLELTLDIVGTTETVGNAGTFPAITIDVTTKPLMFHQMAASINSVTTVLSDLTISGNNMIDRGRFFNSQTLVSALPTDRMITVGFNTPYGDHSAHYALSSAGVTSTFTWTSGNTSLLLSFAAVQYIQQSPIVGGRGEILLPLNGNARRTSGTLELVATLDYAP